MDEGQCFRCGRVPRLCVCPEGVLENPPPPKTESEAVDQDVGAARAEQPEFKVHSECRRPFQYRLLKDGQYLAQASKAIETGTKIHEAMETLAKFGMEMVPIAEEHYSDRGNKLVYTGTPTSNPVLTCELYVKWYALYLVEPNGSIRRAPLELRELEQYAEGESVVGDHCWNPFVVQRLADAKDWLIDDLSFDLLVGRWRNLHDTDDEKRSASEHRHIVSIAMRLAKLQGSDVDPDVSGFLLKVGIKDIDNPPSEWQSVMWRGRMYLLSDLQDEDGIVTGYGLALDWPAPTPDQVQDEDYDLEDGGWD